MLLEWKCPKYWFIAINSLEELQKQGLSAVILDEGQIVGKIIEIIQKVDGTYVKVQVPDKSQKELNDRFYSKISLSSRSATKGELKEEYKLPTIDDNYELFSQKVKEIRNE